MLAIQQGNMGIAFILDERQRLVGTMTDGDVRRALLQGKSMGDPLLPHVQTRFTSVLPGVSRAEVLDLMQARGISQIPIVDGEGELKSVHLLREIVGAMERPNWAVVMAGGQGVRLRPITEHLPKPMIRVAGRPILERIVLHLVGYGFREIFLSVNYLAHLIEEHFGDGDRFGCRIHYLREEKAMGTCGALALLPDRPSHPVLVMNGDLVTQVKLDGLLNYHEAGEFAATIGVRRYYHRVPYGCLCLAGNGTVVSLEEKPLLERWVNAGVYLLSPGVIETVPREYFLMTSLLEGLIKDGRTLGAFEIEEDWIDVGQGEQLTMARGL
jgi:dTDP-glucose pyrophosphorylase